VVIFLGSDNNGFVNNFQMVVSPSESVSLSLKNINLWADAGKCNIFSEQFFFGFSNFVVEPVASRQIQLASKDKLKVPQPESLVLVLRGHVGTNEIGKIEEGLFFST